MSVIIKFPDGKIKLICKGADNVISERLKRTSLNKDIFLQTDYFLGIFAKDGLRTLMFAEKEISI